MPFPDLERIVQIIAENVVTAIESAIGDRLEPAERRHRIVSALMRKLLVDMPTGCGFVLAWDCNRVLSGGPDRGIALPQVADVDMGDGAVTMTPR